MYEQLPIPNLTWREKLEHLADIKRSVEIAALKAKVVAEDDPVEVATDSPKRIKRNRGRGALPLLGAGVKRAQLQTRHHESVDDDPPIFNGRHSPMER